MYVFFAIKDRLWVLRLFSNVFGVMSFDFFSTMIKSDNKKSVRRYIFRLVEDGRYKIVIMNLTIRKTTVNMIKELSFTLRIREEENKCMNIIMHALIGYNLKDPN